MIARSGAALPAAGALLVVLGSAPGSWGMAPHGARFGRVGLEERLANTSVFTISQDRTGFIWLGTLEGLDRFDGQRTTTFRHDPGDPASLSESDVATILVDRSGVLWIGTWGSGLNRFDPATELFARFPSLVGDPTTLRDGRV